MPVPNTLAEWTYDVVKELAEIGQVETNRHDFKFNFSDADSHTKLCCSFANSKGGFIVVGVKERSGRFILKGIDPDPEIANKFGQKLKSIPSIFFERPLLIRIPESTWIFIRLCNEMPILLIHCSHSGGRFAFVMPRPLFSFFRWLCL